jgi:hypothetical protein
MSEKNSYPSDHVGSPDGRFESESRIYREEVKTLLELGIDGGTATRTVSARIMKPDPRLVLRVSVGFQPTSVMVPTSSNLIASASWWVAALSGVGGDLVPAEDVEGASGALVPIIQAAGHRARIIEVDSDYEGIQADLSFGTPGVVGLWRLQCSWCAKYPMSERDWRIARASMRSEFRRADRRMA